jgi:hypothetical protein
MLDRELGDQWEGEAITEREERIEEGKGLFLSLSALVVLLFSLSIAFIWYMIKPRLFEISPYLLTLSGILISLFIIYTIIKFVLTVVSAATGKNILLSLTGNNHNAIKLIYSYSVRIGKLLGISIDRIGNSFVSFNNSLVRALRRKIGRENLLVLLPRCIQYSGCRQKVTEDINNCKDCGKCEITEFKAISRKYGFYVSVATGGSLARKMIHRIKPSTILAVACERELVSGIQDTGKVRVLAVPNWRPEGPCKNTKVDMEKVKDAIEFIFDGDKNKGLEHDDGVAVIATN